MYVGGRPLFEAGAVTVVGPSSILDNGGRQDFNSAILIYAVDD